MVFLYTENLILETTPDWISTFKYLDGHNDVTFPCNPYVSPSNYMV